LRRDIYIPHCEEDHIGECLQSPKSTGSVLDDLDDPIETFGYGVGQMRVDERDDVCSLRVATSFVIGWRRLLRAEVVHLLRNLWAAQGAL
jgi:hypothetical protein